MSAGEVSEPGSPAVQPTAEERAAAASVLQMIWGLHISRAVYVMAELGIADMIADGSMTGFGSRIGSLLIIVPASPMALRSRSYGTKRSPPSTVPNAA
jgi:hypothetical protein